MISAGEASKLKLFVHSEGTSAGTSPHLFYREDTFVQKSSEKGIYDF